VSELVNYDIGIDDETNGNMLVIDFH